MENSRTGLERIREELSFMDRVLGDLVEIGTINGSGAQARKMEVLISLKNLAEASGYLDLLKDVVLSGFDPLFTTHISTIDWDKSDVVSLCDGLGFRDLFAELCSVKAVNGDLRQKVVNYVNAFRLELRPMMAKVFTKGVNIGMGAALINKAVKARWVFDSESMKAEVGLSHVERWLRDEGVCYAELKYDGIRGFAEMKNGECVAIKTYNFSDLDLSKMLYIPKELEELAQMYVDIVGGDHFFFDFEITGKLRQKVSGEVNKLLKGTATVGCDECWKANVFDIVPWRVFDGVTYNKYVERRALLSQGFAGLSLMHVCLANCWEIMTIDGLNKLFSFLLAEGEEGLVVKKASGVYEMKRSSNWIKMKAEKECDLEIVSWFRGNGKREDKIGGFTCASSDRKIVVSVGSGFTDAVLDEVAKNPDSYIGKIVKVRYNVVIDKQDSDVQSLFLPRFVEFRFDKDTANDKSYILNK